MPHTVKLQSYQPSQPPPQQECQAMQQIIVQAVMSLYTESKQHISIFSVTIDQIHRRCQIITRALRDRQEWQHPYRGRETWKRRMQEAAYPDNGARIVSVTNGVYKPNPTLFERAWRRRGRHHGRLLNRVHCPMRREQDGFSNRSFTDCQTCRYTVEVTEKGVWCNYRKESKK